jgi:hypothetical protein
MDKQQINLHVLDLAEYKAPEIVEDRQGEWVLNGEKHSYFPWLTDRYRKSTTNNAIINNMARLIYGRGVHALDASRKPSEYAQLKSIFGAECLRNVGLELKMLGQAYFQVHYKGTGKSRKVVKAYHIPTSLLAPEKCNDDGEIEAYYYSDHWEDTRKHEPKRIPAFGYSDKDVEILCIKPYSVGLKYYATVDYQGCLPYTVLEEEIGDYLINEVQNGFSGTKVVNFNNGVPTEEQQHEIKSMVMRKLTGSKGEKVIVAFNNNQESKTTVDDIPLNDAPEHYAYLSTECQAKILNGHTVTSPMLVGVTVENNGFSSNADEIEVAAKYFYNTSVKPFQELILDAMDKILAVNGVSLDLYFRRLNLLEDIEADAQAKEEQQVNFSSSIDAYLEDFGEEVDDEWELIDEREVDYDLEDELDTQLSQYEEDLKPKSLLSKILELVGTGRANPNRPSEQDQEIDGFYFKVRYKYVGNESPERPFCRAMMRANKVYRKEDILRMNSNIVNPNHGHNGEAYNLFLYKGGVNCHHKWLRQTYVSANKTASIGSHKTSQISTNKARKFGYRVTNPKEVSMMPKDMDNNGHHPEYNG